MSSVLLRCVPWLFKMGSIYRQMGEVSINELSLAVFIAVWLNKSTVFVYLVTARYTNNAFHYSVTLVYTL